MAYARTLKRDRAAAQRLSLPTLLLHDATDRLTLHKHSSQVAGASKMTKLHSAKGLGHIGILADSACMDAVVAFAVESGAANSGKLHSK